MGHFGEFLQGRLGPEGPVALVTLPCPALEVRAWWRPGTAFALFQHGRPVLTLPTLRRLSAALGTGPGGLRLRAGMPPGGGAGASTAARLAAIRAMGGATLDPATLAALCLSLEGASDPLMFSDPAGLLWASRQARVLRALPAPPGFDVLGGYLGPAQRTDPADMRFADIADLVPQWRAAAERGDRSALATLATRSATRNATLRGGPPLDPLLALARALGALGLAAAHTGPARALLFAPGAVPPAAPARLRTLGLTGVFTFRSGPAAPATPLRLPVPAGAVAA